LSCDFRIESRLKDSLQLRDVAADFAWPRTVQYMRQPRGADFRAVPFIRRVDNWVCGGASEGGDHDPASEAARSLAVRASM
jgi:hypothetical protein